MQMILYNNQTDKRYLQKTIQPLETLQNVYLKDTTQVVDPEIELNTLPPTCNYCYLAGFNRYYYLTGVTHENGLFKTKWHVDVLMSFKEDILKSKVIIERSTNHYDMYLQDNELKIDQYTIDQYAKFSTTPFSSQNTSFVLGVLGG